MKCALKIVIRDYFSNKLVFNNFQVLISFILLWDKIWIRLSILWILITCTVSCHHKTISEFIYNFLSPYLSLYLSTTHYFRIPFTLAGTVYNKYLAVDLGRFALKGKYEYVLSPLLLFLFSKLKGDSLINLSFFFTSCGQLCTIYLSKNYHPKNGR